MAQGTPAAKASTNARRKRGPLRLLAVIVGSVVALLLIVGVVVALFGLSIASGIVRDGVASAANRSVQGTVSIGKVDLSWSGPQRFEHVVLKDPDGKVVADVTLVATTRVLPVIFGSRDLGEVALEGTIDIVKTSDEKGTTLERAIEARPPDPSLPAPPAGGPSGGPSRLPKGLAASFVVDQLKVTYTDTTGAGAASSAQATIDGQASFKVGAPALVKFAADALVDGRPAHASLDLTVDHLSNADGLLTVEDAVADGSLVAKAPAGFLAAMPGLGEWIDLEGLSVSPGDEASVVAKINADAGKASGNVKVAGPGIAADLDLAADLEGDDARVWLTRPGTASIVVTPRMAAKAQGDAPTVTLAAPSRLAASIDAFEMPLPEGGAIDLRGAKLKASVAGDDLRGSAQIPGEATARQFALEGISARLTADNLGERAVLEAATRATLDGARAGELKVDMVAEGLTDSEGAPRGMPERLRGVASIHGLATALLEPFVADSGLVLAEDIGPTIDLALRADSAGDSAGVTTVALSAESANLSAAGEFDIAADRVRSRGEGFKATLSKVSPAVQRLLAKSGGADVSASVDQPVTLTLAGVDVPLADGKPQLHRAAATARVATGGVRIGVGGEQETAALRTAEAGVTLKPGEPARVGFMADDQLNGMHAVGDMKLVGLFGADGALRTDAVRPVGTVRVNDLPVALARLAGLGEMLPIINEAAGEKVSVTLTTTEAPNDGLGVVLAVQGESMQLNAEALARAESIELKSGHAALSATPALVSQALAQFAPDLTPRPVLGQPVRLVADAAPVTIPADGWFKPNLQRGPDVKVALRAENDIVVNSAAMLEEQPVDVGLRGFAAEATYSLSRSEATGARVKADVFEPAAPDRRVAGLTGNLQMSAGQIAQGEVKIEGLDTARADDLLNKPGLLEWSLGPAALVEATIKPTGPWPPEKGAGAQAGALAAEVKVQSEKLTTGAALRMDESAITLLRPMEAKWTMDPRWATAYLLNEGSGVSMVAPMALTAKVDRLVLSRGEGPLKPGVFDLKAELTAPGAQLRTDKGEDIVLNGISAKAGTTEAPGAISFDAAIAEVRAPNGTANATAKGALRGLADASGKPTPDAATLDLDVKGTLPTALLDALADKDGLLVELLGATVRADLLAQNFSRQGGSLRADAKAPRADAAMKGRVENGFFVGDDPISARLVIITRSFSSRTLEPIMPFLAKIEKQEEDGPATVTITNLRMPLEKTVDTTHDGTPDKVNLRGLNADVRLDLGSLRFETNDIFGQILEATKNNSSGRLLHNFPPIIARIRDGVLTYDRTKFPVGEFVIETSGTIDLAAENMDLIVYVPIAALVTDIAGVFQKIPGLDVATMTPFRMKGPFGKVKPEPAPDILLKELTQEAPKRFIEEGIGGALDKLLGGDKKK